MQYCPICQAQTEIARVHCSACGVGYDGGFGLPRLARLTPAHQHLAERMTLAGGNLKQVAAEMDISYPTLRKQVDALIAALQALRAHDAERTQRLLDEVERGDTTPERAARLIGEATGGL